MHRCIVLNVICQQVDSSDKSSLEVLVLFTLKRSSLVRTEEGKLGIRCEISVLSPDCLMSCLPFQEFHYIFSP